MDGPILERDWEYLRSTHDEILHELCSRILKKAVEIAGEEGENPHQRYLTLYRHIENSDDIVAECFDDWRRSTISNRVIGLGNHNLLTDAYVKGLSEEAQDRLRMIEELSRCAGK